MTVGEAEEALGNLITLVPGLERRVEALRSDDLARLLNNLHGVAWGMMALKKALPGEERGSCRALPPPSQKAPSSSKQKNTLF